MRIDIHAHTRKLKQGDPVTRDVEVEAFAKAIGDGEVEIIAITNHNHFDLAQYSQFYESVKSHCQVWPGIELDIDYEGDRAHVLVIVSPTKCKEFAVKSEALIGGVSPDDTLLNLETITDAYEEFEPVYVVHYKKDPALNDKGVAYLESLVKFPDRILKEASNKTSTSIYIDHGHKVICGSDVQNWSGYAKNADQLPNLRLPVESFEQFCLLLDKNESTISTILEAKKITPIRLMPFRDSEDFVDLELYSDVNILFGSKGTGKSEILSSLEAELKKKGLNVSLYVGSERSLEDAYDTKCRRVSVGDIYADGEEHVDQIKIMKDAAVVSFTPLSKYVKFFDGNQSNRNAKRLKLKDASVPVPLDNASIRKDYKGIIKELLTFKDVLSSERYSRASVPDDLNKNFSDALVDVLEYLRDEAASAIVAYRSDTLVSNLISTIRREVSKKTGEPEKPVGTGFLDFVRQRMEISKSVNVCVGSLNSSTKSSEEYVGNLGRKGKLYCRTVSRFHEGSISDASFRPVNSGSLGKSEQKKIAKAILDIRDKVFAIDLFDAIGRFSKLSTDHSFSKITDLLLLKKFFTVQGRVYNPSSGESSMLLLNSALLKNVDYYLIDEPERSLGNDYINDVIVPQIKDLAKANKTVVIATHDSNIAVTTLPYYTVYRFYGDSEYKTYYGNPFTNELRSPDPDDHPLDWKKICMKTLEGGEPAFNQRRRIYGT